MYADFISGWAAGGAGILVGYPLDTVKARLQTMLVYKGVMDCVAKTVRQESVYGLYKGVSAPVLSAGILHSLLFTGYGLALRLLHPGESHVEMRKDLPMSELLVASTCGTIAQVIPVIPIELLKTRLQLLTNGCCCQIEQNVMTVYHARYYQSSSTDRAAFAAYSLLIEVENPNKVQRENVSRFTRHSSVLYSGPIECARQIVKNEGFQGLFKGGKVVFFRDIIGYLFYIPVYEVILRFMRTKQINGTISQLFAGGCAGVCGWLSVCPLEVIKNRIQAENTMRIMSAKEVAQQMWNEQGASAFYRGGSALAIRGFVVNAVVFLVYEKVFEIIDKSSNKILFA